MKNKKFLKFNKCGTFFLKNSHSKAYFLNFIQSWTLFPYSYSFKINISSNSFNLEVSFLNDTHSNTYFPKFIQYGTVFCYLYSFKININKKESVVTFVSSFYVTINISFPVFFCWNSRTTNNVKSPTTGCLTKQFPLCFS